MWFLCRTFIEFFETFELWCEAAFAGGVDDEDDFALQVHERVFVAFLVLWLEVVEGSCG